MGVFIFSKCITLVTLTLMLAEVFFNMPFIYKLQLHLFNLWPTY